jgi:hypothetical protein
MDVQIDDDEDQPGPFTDGVRTASAKWAPRISQEDAKRERQ